MLILSRRQGERIMIGDNITLTVVEIVRGKIRLGFDAPRDVVILRQEVADRGPMKTVWGTVPGTTGKETA